MSFTIGKLEQLTGFTATLIRMWERRHRFLQPERLENGHRRYSAEDLAVLRGVRSLLDEGVKIGDIARLGREQLAGRGALPARPLVAVAEARLSAEDEDYLDGRHPAIAWSILEALPCAVLVTDRRGLIRWANRGVFDLCGYEPRELYGGKPGAMLQGPDTDPKAVAELRAAIAGKRSCSLPLVNYHKSGKPYRAMISVAPLGVGASHVGFVGTAYELDGEPSS